MSACAFAANPNLAPSVTPILNPEKSGAELAARLRSAAPAEPSDFKGTLTITTRDDLTTNFQVFSTINPVSNKWMVSYRAVTPDRRIDEDLTIIHTPGQSNSYTLRHKATNQFNQTGVPMLDTAEFIPTSQLARPFAGSDFWLCDLGLEFLQWPQQRVLRHEIRSSRSCWVLESATSAPVPGGYARVVSWVDIEHDGIIRAEAYDATSTNKPVKEFLLGSLRKVDGRHQIESIKMRNLRTGQETELKFDLPGK